MLALLRTRLRIRESDDGIAMVMVISVGAVMTILIVAAIAMSMGTLKKSAADSSWNAALAAAYAGAEEYQSRLTDEAAYVKYGNPASTFSSPTGPASAKVQLPPTTNPAFGLGASGTWAVVEGSSGEAQYRYEVDNLKYADTGTIRLRVTGKVGDKTRSLVADLRQKGFIDFLYFTDYEMSDYSITGTSACLTPLHEWEGRTGCNIQFAPSDTFGGPVHSNDTLYICGATKFLGTVTTGNPDGTYTRPSGCADAVWSQGKPVYSPAVSMPATNTQLKKETRSDLTGTDVPRPGCLYTGPTQITFTAGGKMVVKSPWTKFTSITGDTDAPTGGNNLLAAQCGSIADLQSAAGATVPVPANNVVFVQNIPLTGINSATDAQTTTTGSPTRCKSITGTALQNNKGYSRNVVGFPIDDEVPLVQGTGATASYGCRNGDLFLQGDLSGGAVTVAAQNYVYVTGDVKYSNVDTDLLGIVGQNAVWVYNPMNSSGSPVRTALNRRIDAAILSLAHTFVVQNYNKGPTSGRGTLTVNGAIAQKFRGPVALTSGQGYDKNYVYDQRLRYTAPPKFLSPVTTTYGITLWVEVQAAFDASGVYR